MPCNRRYVHARQYDVLWAEIGRLGVPIVFHGTNGGTGADYASNRFRGLANFRTLNHVSTFPMDLMLAMGAMLVGDVLEKFPELRAGFLEGNCGWLPWWLTRLDDQWRKYADGPFPNGVNTYFDLPGVGRANKEKIIWDNCRRLYGFDADAAA